MNTFSISITPPGIKDYPLHQHPTWEVMYYLSGSGYLATSGESLPFEPGSIMIVPPHIAHGSVSTNGFKNISISGDFSHLFHFKTIAAQKDDRYMHCGQLAQLIYENRYTTAECVASLCNAYAHFLIKNAEYKKPINSAIDKIIESATFHFYDPAFDITAVLRQSGYAEDYIRSEFKKATAMSPIDFLTKIRIDHAVKLLEIYADGIRIAELAESCGFNDPIYFSRRFRQLTGRSPLQYQKQLKIKKE